MMDFGNIRFARWRYKLLFSASPLEEFTLFDEPLNWIAG